MPSPRRLRIRFSIRTLLVLVTLVALYFGSWQICRERALAEVQEYVDAGDGGLVRKPGQVPTVPFVMPVDAGSSFSTGTLEAPPYRRRYFLWLFGYVVKLPYEPLVETW